MLSTFTFSDNTIGFIIKGDFNSHTTDELQQTILEKIAEHGTVNLYMEDDGIESFSLSAVIEEIHFKFQNANSINKIAIVSDRKWMSVCVSFESLFLSSKIKYFEVENRINALNWISEMS